MLKNQRNVLIPTSRDQWFFFNCWINNEKQKQFLHWIDTVVYLTFAWNVSQQNYTIFYCVKNWTNFFSDITLHFWMGVLETKRERVGRGWAGRAAVNEEQMWISKEVHKSLAAFLTTQHASCLHPALPYVCVCFCYVTGWRSRFCPLTKQERLSVKRFLKVNK